MMIFFSFVAEGWAQDVHEHSLAFPPAAETVQRGSHNLLAEYLLPINIINGDLLHLEG